MSDIATVASGLVKFCANIFYPNGATSSITGGTVIVKRGQLTEADLTGSCSLKGGNSFITIMPLEGGYKRIGEELGMPWRSGAVLPATVSLSVAGRNVTVSLEDGAAPSGLAGIRLTTGFDSEVAAYAVTSTDTAATIAAALAAQISGATVAGAVITIAPGPVIAVATAAHVTGTRITRRQGQLFQITLWTSTPVLRDKLAYMLDAGMSGAPWFLDSTDRQCLLTFSGSYDVDTQQSQGIFRRVFRMSVIFDTTQEQQLAQVMFAGIALHPGDSSEVVHIGDQPLF